MKCLILITIIYTLHITLSIKLSSSQWPKVNHIKKSAYLPSLEVKIHPPDIYQPQIQTLIHSLETKREQKERQLLIQIEHAYNNELMSAYNLIVTIIQNALSLFDNDNLFHKSISYALTSPIVILSPSTQRKYKQYQHNGPITSFIETNSQYTKPISVTMKIPKEPDVRIKTEIERMEQKRDELEMKLFNQALIELKLITKITIKELQLCLKKELIPFYSILNNKTISDIDNVLNSRIKDVSSFIEKGSDEDFINVKFASGDDINESYPTIEKIVSQMMTRRDLSEKYIRLKILEFESRLQRALSEMIEDILHDNIYHIIAKYAPAIEGIKEHIK